MCWKTNKLRKDCPQLIADDDITVYKVAYYEEDKPLPCVNSIRSYYKRFNYLPGVTYRLGNDLKMSDEKTIDEGFHSYSGDVEITCNIEKHTSIDALGLKYIGYAYFDSVEFESRSIFDYFSIHKVDNLHLSVIRCKIPKGAKYYINEYGEVVSDAITIGEMMTEKNDIVMFDSLAKGSKYRLVTLNEWFKTLER